MGDNLISLYVSMQGHEGWAGAPALESGDGRQKTDPRVFTAGTGVDRIPGTCCELLPSFVLKIKVALSVL